MRKYVILTSLLFLIVSAATATTVTISPTKIDSGDTVTVDVKGLSDGATFALSIDAKFDVPSGDVFAFTARDLSLPFSLGEGKMEVYTKGTEWASISIEQEDMSGFRGKDADENGELWISQPIGNISEGTYGLITLKGEAATSTIISEMTMSGKKKGPNDGRISFALAGIEHGTATVAVYVDGSEVLSRQITIGSPSSGGNGGTGGTGSTGGSSGPSGPSVPPSDPATKSADGKASLTGTGVGNAKILSSAVEGTLPAGWTTAGRGYSITPAECALDATLSLTLPASNTTAATIARLENGAWSPVPSKIKGDQITTKVIKGGSYAILIPADEAPTQTVTKPTTSVTATTTAPATTPASSTPLAAFLPVAACAILMLVRGRRS